MSGGDVALIIGIVLLVIGGGLFAAADAALNAVSAARVDELAKDERPGARRLALLVADRPRYVNLLVLLRIICEITATVLLADLTTTLLSLTPALALSAVIMVLLSYLVIGVGPRTVGRQRAYPIALAAALPIQALGRLLDPVSRLLIVVGNAITPGRGFRQGPFATELELRELVDLAQERGVVAATERRMIQSVFDLGDTPAREVMVPRTEMVWIEREKTAGQAISLAVRSGHSRVPVIGENVDDVLGVVYLKDLVQRTYHVSEGSRRIAVGDLMRPAAFLPDSKPLDDLLAQMQRTRNHMAILVDEYGGIAGLVTIEDVLEEIVGEIADEYDTHELAPVTDCGDGSFRVSARLPLDDLGELFDVEIEDPEVDTVGGLVAHVLGRVPLPGAEVRTHGLGLRAEGGDDSRGRIRITTVLAWREEPDDTDGAADSTQGGSEQTVTQDDLGSARAGSRREDIDDEAS